MAEEKEEFEMGIPNGVGEAMLAHAFEKFDVKLEQTEWGPKLIGEYDELVKARDFLENAIRERLKELSGEQISPHTLFFETIIYPTYKFPNQLLEC